MTNCNAKATPASGNLLGTDVNGPIHNADWDYAQAVGMAMYLSNNTRPDIQFATHQCARFSHTPKASHTVALKRICKYLKGTRDKGIIFKPDMDLKLDCYVDADFAGLWGMRMTRIQSVSSLGLGMF